MKSAVTGESPVYISDDRLCYGAIRALNYHLNTGIHVSVGMNVIVGMNMSVGIYVDQTVPPVDQLARHEIGAW